MRYFLLFLSLLAFAAASLALLVSKSAVQEIEAFVLFLIAAVLFTGFAIVGAVNAATESFKKSPSAAAQASPNFIE